MRRSIMAILLLIASLAAAEQIITPYPLHRRPAAGPATTNNAVWNQGGNNRFSSSTQIKLGATASVSFWAKILACPGTQTLYMFLGSGNYGSPVWHGFLGSCKGSEPGNLTWHCGVAYAGTKAYLNQWTHVVFVSLGNGTVDCYTNGSFANNQSLGGYAWDNTTPFYLGDAAWGYRPNVVIDDVAVWTNKALSATDVSVLYNNGVGLMPDISLAPYNDPKLVGLWCFSEMQGTTASNKASTGTAYDAPTSVGTMIWTNGIVTYTP